MKSYISSIGTAVPSFKIEQNKAADWMSKALNLDAREERALRSLYQSSGIESRYSVLGDYLVDRGEFDFFPNTVDLEPFPNVTDRMVVYKSNAIHLATEACRKCIDEVELSSGEITHLITVSCTGMYAPGLDLELLQTLDLRKNTERTAIQFMGCYAAFNALKMADYICRAESTAKVLIVTVELCSLHFLKEKTRDQLVSNALFGDGAAAAIVSSNPLSATSLSLDAFSCILAPDSSSHMAWNIEQSGFRMALSSYVPNIIKENIKPIADKMMSDLGLKKEEVTRYAIHPGGKRILEACEEALNLTTKDNELSYDILRKYGNMSSSTILFVLKEIMDKMSKADDGNKLLSFAFGPGLSMEAALLEMQYV